MNVTDYKMLEKQLISLLDKTDEKVTVLANAASFIYTSLDRINWAGFYILRGTDLKLGPFMGNPACTVIHKGKGVCGSAVAEDRTLVVKDVHKFPGHIACDSASNSEIVTVLKLSGKTYGVLDIDSPVYDRFDDCDRQGIESLSHVIEKALENCIY